MSTKNEVFEYLIDQLRQQVNKKDVTSFDVSVRISDLDEVKQVIHNLQQHIAGKDDEIRALKDSLRQQVGNNPYKQQCEDPAHEVQSLKNQLRDASARIKELTCALDCAENEVMCLRSIVDLDPKGAIGYIRRANSAMTDTMRRQYLSKALEELGCKDAPEQSGCRKEDTQECDHNWIIAPGLFIAEGHKDNVPGSRFCCECGAREWDDKEYVPKAGAQKCKHEWEYYYPNGEEHRRCAKCGVITEQSGCRKEDTQECGHDWVLDEKGDYFVCAKCGEQEAELVDCQHINTVGLRKGFAPGFTKKCLDCGAKLK